MLTIVATLLFFATAQMAQAFDTCCLTEGKAIEGVLSVKADPSGKSDMSQTVPKAKLTHCAAGCHVSVSVLPLVEGVLAKRTAEERDVWPAIAAHAPFISEQPIEPPSLA